MTNKKKKRARDLSAKTGMSHQAAVNALNEGDRANWEATVASAKEDSGGLIVPPLNPNFSSWLELQEYIQKIPESSCFEWVRADEPDVGKVGYYFFRFLDKDGVPFFAPCDTPEETLSKTPMTEESFFVYYEPFGHIHRKETSEYKYEPQMEPYDPMPKLLRSAGESKLYKVDELASIVDEPVVAIEGQGMVKETTTSEDVDTKGPVSYSMTQLSLGKFRASFGELAATKKLFKNDNPKTLRKGYVFFEDGVSHTVLFPLVSLKERMIGTVNGVPFLDWDNRVPELRSVMGEHQGPLHGKAGSSFTR